MEPQEISVIEVHKAIKSLKCGKAAGVDEIRPEMLKAGGTITVQWLHHIMQKAWEEGRIPEDWNKAIIVPIYKKGNKMECSNYRGISLLSVPGKVYASTLRRELGENQAAFAQITLGNTIIITCLLPRMVYKLIKKANKKN